VGFLRNVVGSPSGDPDDERVRVYLADANEGPRTEWLFWSVVTRLADSPLAESLRIGEALTGFDLTASSEMARAVMAQDRDLCGPLVRKSTINLKLILGSSLGTDLEGAFELGLGGIGMAHPSQGALAYRDGAGDHLSEVERDGGLATVDLLLSVLHGRLQPPQQRAGHGGWNLYTRCFTELPGGEAEEIAYSLIGMAGVIIARLRNAERIVEDLPFLAPSWKRVPVLTQAGWWPNPSKHGEMVDGIPSIQRYWDGAAWSERVRMRRGREWRIGSVGLHQPPED
jgi:hypothetical protein